MLDVDPGHSGDETLAAWVREHGDLPTTVEVCTGAVPFLPLIPAPLPAADVPKELAGMFHGWELAAGRSVPRRRGVLPLTRIGRPAVPGSTGSDVRPSSGCTLQCAASIRSGDALWK